jgi:hypothetical protein
MFRAWALLAAVVLVAQALKAHQPLLLAVWSGRFLRVVWAAARVNFVRLSWGVLATLAAAVVVAAAAVAVRGVHGGPAGSLLRRDSGLDLLALGYKQRVWGPLIVKSPHEGASCLRIWLSFRQPFWLPSFPMK